MINDHYVKNFFGLKTRWEDESIKPGYASQSLNWVTKSDHIELRRGQALMGSNIAGSGNISGIAVGELFDGTEVMIETYDQKVKYYDEPTSDWIEAGTDVLPVLASGEDMAISTYYSLAGAMFYISSKNSSVYKLPIANPASIVDQLSTDHRGKIAIKQNRMFLWDRKDANGGFDTTGLYGSYIDKDELSDYTEVSAEAIGAMGSTNYTGTLAFKTGFPVRTAMYVSITSGIEVFRDTRNGTLVSNLGATGTINYATGEYNVTFSAVTTAAVTADYYWEDSTSTGILDFSFDLMREAGQGFVFRQDDGGAQFQNIFSLGSTEYCMHGLKTWGLTLTSDDTDATNLIYRAKVGLPNWRGGCETGDGIYYVDATDPSAPAVRLLYIGGVNSQVLPKSISDDLDLSGYAFDKTVLFEWGDYICIACRTLSNTINDTFFMYNRKDEVWDMHDFRVSACEKYNGGLVGGDSGSRNTFALFSGLTDEDNDIPNAWVSNKDRLDVEGSKYFNIFKVKGLIDLDQNCNVEFSYDNAPFVLVGTVSGQGSYVDKSQHIVVGSYTEGSKELGGGGSGIEASPYEYEFRVNTPIFEALRVRFTATDVGYVSISEYAAKDIRFKGRRVQPQYSAT